LKEKNLSQAHYATNSMSQSEKFSQKFSIANTNKAIQGGPQKMGFAQTPV
jgi:hypothetical protein